MIDVYDTVGYLFNAAACLEAKGCGVACDERLLKCVKVDIISLLSPKLSFVRIQ